MEVEMKGKIESAANIIVIVTLEGRKQ